MTLTIREAATSTKHRTTQTIGDRANRGGRPVLVTSARSPVRREGLREAIKNLTGKTISSYRIAAKVGSGGMGIVYRAKDLRLQRYVALKFISGDNLTEETLDESIRREAVPDRC